MSEIKKDNSYINNKEEGNTSIKLEKDFQNIFIDNNLEKVDSNEDFQNNLFQSDNGINQEDENDNDNNLINYEIKNEEDLYQNNLASSSEFNNNENNFNVNDDKKEDNEINENVNNEMESGEDNNQNEDNEEIPLITLNAIAVCQCCKSNFNNKENLPYLLKCGHFFCINCINQYFKDKSGIICPSDGLVAKSIKELKLLKNLITSNKNDINDNNENSNINITNEDNSLSMSNNKKNTSFSIDKDIKPKNNQYCLIHKDQKLTHINCQENKLICIYCAYELLKNNPKCDIKEIKERVEEYKTNIDAIIDITKNSLDKINFCLKQFKKIKDEQESKINNLYTKLIEYLNNKKNEDKEKLNNIFENNTKEIEKNIKIFNEIIEKGNFCTKLIEQIQKDNNIIFDIIKNYNNFYNLYQTKNNVDKFEYIIFKNDNEKEIINYLNNITEIEKKYEFMNYMPDEIKKNYMENENNNNYNKNELNNEINFNNYLNNNNFIEKINDYSSDINLEKYTFHKSNRNLKRININNDENMNLNSDDFNQNKYQNNNFTIDTMYKTLPLNNGIEKIKFGEKEMPIHNSYLFHRNIFKNDDFLKEKYNNNKDMIFQNNTMTNFYKVNIPFIAQNKNINNYNNKYDINSPSYKSLSNNSFPYDFRHNKIFNFK